MKLAIGINQYEIPEDLADNIIRSCKESTSNIWNKSVLSHQDSGQDIRTSSDFNLDSVFPELAKTLKHYVDWAVQGYCNEYQISVTQSEGLDLLRYESGQKYDFHYDTDWHYYRTVSILVYLNPAEYSGGETHFKHFDVKVKPEKPSIVVFPSSYAYLHSALPVISGEKFIVVSWMNDLPIGIKPDSFYLINSGLPL